MATRKSTKTSRQKPHKKKLGPPEVKLSQNKLQRLDQLARDNCKDYTIANILDIDVTTLKKHYSKRLVKKRAEGQGELRRTQRRLSKKNPAMAIFLGKNELEQRDKREYEHSGEIILKPPQIT